MQNKHKVLKYILLLFAILSVLQLTITIPVFAASNGVCPKCNVTHPRLSGVKGVALNWHNEVYLASPFGEEGDTNGETGISVAELIEFDTSGTFAPVWEIAESIYNAVMIVGIMLCVIAGLSRIITEYTGDSLSPEKLANLLMKLAIGVIIIRNGFEITTACMNLALLITRNVSAATSATFAQEECIHKQLLEADFSYAFGVCLKNAFPYLATRALTAVASLVCWIRAFDLITRLCFMPIGLHNLVYTGTQGSGFSYLKKLLATGAQGAALVAILAAYRSITNMLIAQGSIGGFITILIVYGATIIMMWKSQTLIKDVMGTS